MKINIRVIRYILIIVSIIISTYAIQIFVQNFNIEKEIVDLKNTQKQLSGDNYWIKNYYEPFLKTEYAKMYFAHRAGVIGENEVLIKIVYFDSNNVKEKEVVDKKYNNVYNEQENTRCLEFFKTLYDKYFNL